MLVSVGRVAFSAMENLAVGWLEPICYCQKFYCAEERNVSPPSVFEKSMSSGFFCAESGVRAHQQLVKFVLGARFMTQEGAHDCAHEAERDAQDSRVLEWEDGFRLDQVASRSSDRGWIDRHDAWAD